MQEINKIPDLNIQNSWHWNKLWVLSSSSSHRHVAESIIVLANRWAFKGATIPTRPVSKWGGVMIKLPTCYTQRSMLTVLYVVCYQSVNSNLNNISGYVYNRELITQPTPISHSPNKFKFWILTVGFISQTQVSNGVIKHILVSIICVTFNVDACKVSFLYYL